ncbi:hypothetical protein ZWY2020_004769 [Hordeum vulgare]|nr:hypothetical protein ZWY2020_004769 [Hordeum vulgare]
MTHRSYRAAPPSPRITTPTRSSTSPRRCSTCTPSGAAARPRPRPHPRLGSRTNRPRLPPHPCSPQPAGAAIGARRAEGRTSASPGALPAPPSPHLAARRPSSPAPRAQPETQPSPASLMQRDALRVAEEFFSGRGSSDEDGDDEDEGFEPEDGGDAAAGFFLGLFERDAALRGLAGSRDDDGHSTEGQGYATDINSIREAQARIAPYVHKTPILSSTSIDAIVRKQLFFKCECFQKAGAFKIRGASNSIFALDNSQAAKGVVTHSGGNHDAAMALAAKLRRVPAYIVIPKDTPACKVDNVKRYGGQVIWSDVTMDSRESMAKKGTVCLELLEQVPKIDTIIAINPSIRILPAEPKGADDSAQSKAGGRIIKLPATNTIADGLRAFLGDLTWPVVRDLVEDVIVVYDNAIVDAMKMCYETLKVAVELSGAIGLAAVLSGDEFKQSSAWHESGKIGIIVSRGNVDLCVLWDSLYK